MFYNENNSCSFTINVGRMQDKWPGEDPVIYGIHISNRTVIPTWWWIKFRVQSFFREFESLRKAWRARYFLLLCFHYSILHQIMFLRLCGVTFYPLETKESQSKLNSNEPNLSLASGLPPSFSSSIHVHLPLYCQPPAHTCTHPLILWIVVYGRHPGCVCKDAHEDCVYEKPWELPPSVRMWFKVLDRCVRERQHRKQEDWLQEERAKF